MYIRRRFRDERFFLKTLCAGGVRLPKSPTTPLAEGSLRVSDFFLFFGDLANNDKRLCFVPLFSVFPKLSAQGASAKVALRSLGRGQSARVGLFSFLVTFFCGLLDIFGKIENKGVGCYVRT